MLEPGIESLVQDLKLEPGIESLVQDLNEEYGSGLKLNVQVKR